MRKKPKHGEASAADTTYTVVSLMRDAAGTTWRMFVPIIGLFMLGGYGDQRFDTGYVLTVIGLIIGCAISYLLIKRQLSITPSTK